MVTWSLFDGRPAEWASVVGMARDRNVVQAHAWGEYRRAAGWEPQRWIAWNGSRKPLCCMQTLVKPLPLGQRLIWVPGGPVVGFPDTDPSALDAIIGAWLEEARRRHPLRYVRFSSHLPHGPEARHGMSQVCVRPLVCVNSGYTIHIDLSVSLDELRSRLTAKHRYYVKQAEAAGLHWRWGHAPELLAAAARLHGEVARAKSLASLEADMDDTRRLLHEFGDDAFILVGYQGDEPVTSCCVLTFADTAFYFRAATGGTGRRVSAGYAMMVQLFRVLKSRGTVRFDFGGIAPGSDQAAGVDHFKRGFGGDVVQYLGEWEWPTRGLVRRAVNYGVRRRAW